MLNKSMINSMLPSLFFEVTSLQIFDVKLVSMLQFSMFPYLMLPTSLLDYMNLRIQLKKKKICCLILLYLNLAVIRTVVYVHTKSHRVIYKFFIAQSSEGLNNIIINIL